MTSELAGLSDAELLQLWLETSSTNKLQAYRPYGHPDTYEDWWHVQNFGEVRKWSGKPWQLEFHNAGKHYKERMTVCANGVGKSLACCAETAIHATGRYPEWWDGHEFDGGVPIWVGSINNKMQKIGPQKILLGDDLKDNLGTGFIPRDALKDIQTRQAGIKDVVESVTVKCSSAGDISGGDSHIEFLTYEQGWRSWQGGAPRIIQMDEEPDENDLTQADVFTEIQTRLVRNAGILYCGYTPLLGETKLTRHFMYPEADGIWYIGATWDDVAHLDEGDKDRLRATYPSHQVKARTMGIPMMGEGAIFTVPEDDFTVAPFDIPPHFARILGIDFGIGHPAAVAALAWDRDADIVYLHNVWRRENVETAVHAQAIKDMGGASFPVAWPHDGGQRDREKKEEIHKIYRRRYGVTGMLNRSARYDNNVGGAQPQWPVIEQLQDRLATGRFKVFTTCTPWLEEYRSYHVKDGRIVSKRDDALKASFYALMDLRYARAASAGRIATASVPGPALSTRLG